MSQQTDFCDIPFPSENDDPYWQTFESMMTWFDNQNFALLSSVGNVLVPPGSVNWDASSGQLTWSDDFIMPILSTGGFRFFIRFGPDNATRVLTLNDGDIVVITAPFTSAENIVANFTVIPAGNKVQFASGLFVFGMRVGTRFVANIPQVFT